MNFDNKYNIAVVGATGLVGRELLKLLENFPICKIKCFASKKSEGKKIFFKNEQLTIETINNESLEGIDIVFFCAGSTYSKKYLPLAEKHNCLVIDLSSAFRMEDNIPLIIPEINARDITENTKIIASPNCTTTIMLMALFPLHKEYKIKRIVASTYQAASGGGIKLLNKLENDSLDVLLKKDSISRDYGFNLFLHESPMQENGYSEEEMKMDLETKKILKNQNIKVSATCVRVPVIRAHSISMNVEFEDDITVSSAYSLLRKAPNIKIFEDRQNNKFATPHDVTAKNETFVSRIRKDPSQKNTIELWAVGDQLLKGAALNGYQIAEHYIAKFPKLANV